MKCKAYEAEIHKNTSQTMLPNILVHKNHENVTMWAEKATHEMNKKNVSWKTLPCLEQVLNSWIPDVSWKILPTGTWTKYECDRRGTTRKTTTKQNIVNKNEAVQNVGITWDAQNWPAYHKQIVVVKVAQPAMPPNNKSSKIMYVEFMKIIENHSVLWSAPFPVLWTAPDVALQRWTARGSWRRSLTAVYICL